MSRLTIPQVRARKGKEKLVVLTAYTTPMARLLDPYVDVLLVGDSLGMVLYGMEDTLGVSPAMMEAHAGAVVRGSERASVVVDLPFNSYQASPGQAMRTAGRLLARSKAQAVKLEGGAEMAETVAFLTARGVPVMGHLGLQPQSMHMQGGYRVQGKAPEDAARIKEGAKALEEAGAFALVLEGMPADLAGEVTALVAIPTIGIGAGAKCDGQVLVAEDMLGLSGQAPPSFVRPYAAPEAELEKAAEAYAKDVRSGAFPG